MLCGKIYYCQIIICLNLELHNFSFIFQLFYITLGLCCAFLSRPVVGVLYSYKSTPLKKVRSIPIILVQPDSFKGVLRNGHLIHHLTFWPDHPPHPDRLPEETAEEGEEEEEGQRLGWRKGYRGGRYPLMAESPRCSPSPTERGESEGGGAQQEGMTPKARSFCVVTISPNEWIPLTMFD